MMEKDLPEGWVESQLSQVLKLKNGFAFNSNDYSLEGIPVIRISDIQDGKVTTNNSVKVPEPSLNTDFVIEKGDILIAMSGATTGKIGIFNESTVALQNQRVGNFKLHSETLISKSFIYYSIQSLKSRIEEQAYGGAQPNISSKLIEELNIPLPPLAEQRRIVAKLDAAFGLLDRMKERLARIPELLKTFRQAVLTQAVTGKLTEEWREDETMESLPKSWKIEFLKEIGYVSGGITLNAKRRELTLQVDYLRVANVYANELRLSEIKQIGVTEAEYKKTLLKKDDLLIVEGNGSIDQIGRVAIWDDSITPCLHQNHLIRVRIDKKSSSRYVLYYLLSPIGREAIKNESSSTTGLHTLNISKVGNLQIPFPPLAEQQEIVRRVEALLAKADALEAQYLRLKEKIDRLPQALLAQAFRGKLVPQDPDDEPAAVLLGKIKGAGKGKQGVLF